MQTSGFQPKMWCKTTTSTAATAPPASTEPPKIVVPVVLKNQLYTGDIRESSLLAITQSRHSNAAKMPQGYQPTKSALGWPTPAPQPQPQQQQQQPVYPPSLTQPLPSLTQPLPSLTQPLPSLTQPLPSLTQVPPANVPRPQPRPQACSSLWAEKHRPQQIRHFMGNTKAKDSLVKWVTARKRNPGTSHNPCVVALLSGPPGVGKTTIANLVLRDLGFTVVEVNASDTRTRRVIYELIKETVTRKPLRKPCAIILDELDGAVSQVGNSTESDKTGDEGGEGDEDNSGVAGVWQFVEECKKHQWPVAYPIICISNDVASKPMRQLMSAAQNIKFYAPYDSVVKDTLKSICNKEGIRLNSVQQNHVVEAARGDLRRLCQLLQMISIRPLSLNTQMADMLQNSKSDGTVDDLFPSVRRLLYGKDDRCYSGSAGQQLVEKDPAIITVMVHENLPTLASRGMAEASATPMEIGELNQLAACYDDLSLVDALDTVDWQARGCEDNVSAALLSGTVRIRCQPFRQAALHKGGGQHVAWTQYFDQRHIQSSQAEVVSAARYAWQTPVMDLGLVHFIKKTEASETTVETNAESDTIHMQIDPDLETLANQWEWKKHGTTPKSTPKKKRSGFQQISRFQKSF